MTAQALNTYDQFLASKLSSVLSAGTPEAIVGPDFDGFRSDIWERITGESRLSPTAANYWEIFLDQHWRALNDFYVDLEWKDFLCAYWLNPGDDGYITPAECERRAQSDVA